MYSAIYIILHYFVCNMFEFDKENCVSKEEERRIMDLYQPEDEYDKYKDLRLDNKFKQAYLEKYQIDLCILFVIFIVLCFILFNSYRILKHVSNLDYNYYDSVVRRGVDGDKNVKGVCEGGDEFKNNL